MPRVTCPHCKVSQAVERDQLGHTIRCSSCEGAFKLAAPKARPSEHIQDRPIPQAKPTLPMEDEDEDEARRVAKPKREKVEQYDRCPDCDEFLVEDPDECMACGWEKPKRRKRRKQRTAASGWTPARMGICALVSIVFFVMNVVLIMIFAPPPAYAEDREYSNASNNSSNVPQPKGPVGDGELAKDERAVPKNDKPMDRDARDAVKTDKPANPPTTTRPTETKTTRKPKQQAPQPGELDPITLGLTIFNFLLIGVLYFVGTGMEITEEMSPGPGWVLVFLACCCTNLGASYMVGWFAAAILGRWLKV